MALILQYINDMHIFMDKYGDPRTNHWFLMSSPFPTLIICLSYIYLVKVFGPRFMESRKPYELKNLLVLYNFSQVIFSAWLFYEAVTLAELRSDILEIYCIFFTFVINFYLCILLVNGQQFYILTGKPANKPGRRSWF